MNPRIKVFNFCAVWFLLPFITMIVAASEVVANEEDVEITAHARSSISHHDHYQDHGKKNKKKRIVQQRGLFLPRWNPRATHYPCNIRRVTWAEIKREFGPSGLPPLHPDPLVILAENSATQPSSSSHSSDTTRRRNQLFRHLSQEDRILESFPPNFTVTLSSSNSFSEHRRKIPLVQYLSELKDSVDRYRHHQSSSPHDHEYATIMQTISDATQKEASSLSNETWYLFGETYSPEWKAFLKNYELPICLACFPDSVALSFGIGNCGSGVQWHVHGPGFSESIVGKKRKAF